MAAEGVLTRRREWLEYSDGLAMLGYATVAVGDDAARRDRLTRHEERAVRRWLGMHLQHLEAVANALLAAESLDDDGL
jgi:hypothetical protein